MQTLELHINYTLLKKNCTSKILCLIYTSGCVHTCMYVQDESLVVHVSAICKLASNSQQNSPTSQTLFCYTALIALCAAFRKQSALQNGTGLAARQLKMHWK